MVDFNFKSGGFPIGEVISAAQRKAALEQQAKTEGNQSLVQGLQAIGGIGQSLVDQRLKVARSLALGKQFGVPEDQARLMDPDDILKTAAVNKGGVDMQMLFSLLHPGAAAAAAGMANPQGATPASQTTPAAAPQGNGAILASNTTTTPITPPAPVASQAAPVPVPIAAPPVRPVVNKATADLAYKMAMAGRNEPVMTQQQALDAGAVPKGTHIVSPKESSESDKTQDKLEQQYRSVLVKPLSNRSGGLGLEDAKVNQAIHLRTLINKFYDPKTQTYNIPPSMHAELALGLARLQSPTGQVGIELVKELRQATAREGLSGALIYLGADPKTVGGTTQGVSRLFIDSIDRQGTVSQANREQYMDYLRSLRPTELDPARAEKLEAGRLNSFDDLLKRSPDQMHQESIDLGTAYTDAEKEKRFQAYKARKSL